MQNNFDKLNEIFGVKKPEEGQSPRLRAGDRRPGAGKGP